MDFKNRLQIKSNIPTSKKVILNLLVSSASLNDRMSEILKPFELSGPQFNVLRILRGQKGKPANLENIQQRMIHRSSNTTRLVDKLIEKGFAKRFICQQNRRKVEINITQKGLDLLKKIDPKAEAIDEIIEAHFSKEEMEELNILLEKLQHVHSSPDHDRINKTKN